MEQKNAFLAIAISAAFLIVWFNFVVPRLTPPAPPAPPATAAPADSVAKTEGVLPSTSRDRPVAMEDITYRDEKNEIVLTPRGGAVKSWRLKLKGQEIDLVLYPEAEALPLATFPDANFKITPRGNEAIMEAMIAPGVRLTKTLALNPNGFLQDLTLRFENATAQPVALKDWQWGWGPGLGTAVTEHKDNSGLIRAISFAKLNAHKLKPGEYSMGQWAGIDNRYFMVVFIPPPGDQPQFIVDGTKDQTRIMLRESTSVPARGHVELHYSLYAGPKGYTQLKKYGKNLEEGVDFGVFSPVGKLILSAIYALQRWTGNYGWAIVILTLGLQVLTLPLSLKSFKATIAMKKLQPQIAVIQKQYKSDPKRLNIEMMNLYKKGGTNPLGGCLPMVLQLPIFWALFTTLRNAYELRGAPFIFWIHDLSMADPYRILPIVMGVAMFFQQRMSGAASDPTQRQMMTIMPVMFTVMFMNFPAGLVLYWLTNNLLSMASQRAFLAYSAETPQVIETTLVK